MSDVEPTDAVAHAQPAEVSVTAFDAAPATDEANALVSSPPTQEFALPTAEVRVEGVAPTINATVTPEPIRASVQMPPVGVSVGATAGVAEARATAFDATVETSSGVSGALDVALEPDVLEAQGTVGSNDQVTTGLLSGGATLAASPASESDTAVHPNEMTATQTQTPSLDTQVIRPAPTLDEATEAELTAIVPHDAMASIESVIVQLRRELEERDHRHDERVQEMTAELVTLNAQLASSKPKRSTVTSALWAIGGWAVGIGNNMLANYAYDALRKVLGL